MKKIICVKGKKKGIDKEEYNENSSYPWAKS